MHKPHILSSVPSHWQRFDRLSNKKLYHCMWCFWWYKQWYCAMHCNITSWNIEYIWNWMRLKLSNDARKRNEWMKLIRMRLWRISFVEMLAEPLAIAKRKSILATGSHTVVTWISILLATPFDFRLFQSENQMWDGISGWGHVCVCVHFVQSTTTARTFLSDILMPKLRFV